MTSDDTALRTFSAGATIKYTTTAIGGLTARIVQLITRYLSAFGTATVRAVAATDDVAGVDVRRECARIAAFTRSIRRILVVVRRGIFNGRGATAPTAN